MALNSFKLIFSALLFLVVVLFQTPGVAQSNAGGAAETRQGDFQSIRSKVDKFTLSNGIRVLVYKRSFSPIFTGQIWVKVGGVDEVPGETGLAHFLEHMAFKGSKTIGTENYEEEAPLLEELERIQLALQINGSKELRSELEEVTKKLEKIWKPNEFSKLYKQRGATGLNAGTSKDYTVYLVNLPVSAFDYWLWAESDRLLNPVFRQFYKEREVVQEERRGRVENNPSGKLYEALLATSYWTHPNRLPVIGWPSDIKNLSASSMRAFYEKHYRPDNIVITLVGDIDAEEVKPKLEKHFGVLPKREGPRPRLFISEEEQTGPRESVVYYDANPQFFLSWHKPAWPNPEDAHFAVLHTILSDGRSSVFHRELVQQKKLALSAYSTEAPGERYPPLFVLGAIPNQGVSNEKLTQEMQAILDRYKETLFSSEEVMAAKRRIKVSMLEGLDSNASIARMIGKAEALWDDWEMVFESYDQIMATTPEDLRSLLRKYSDPDRRTWVRLERPPVKGSDKEKEG